MSETPTPRTEANIKVGYLDDGYRLEYIDPDDARQLERELITTQEALVYVQNLINGVQGSQQEDKRCLDTAWDVIQGALSSTTPIDNSRVL